VSGVGLTELFCILAVAAIAIGGPLVGILVAMRLRGRASDDERR